MKSRFSKVLFALIFPVVAMLTAVIFSFSSMQTADAVSGSGGGFYVGKNSTFNFSGTMHGISASYGGGAYIASGGTLNMTSGSIYGNTATINGDNIYNAGTFTITSGIVGASGVTTQNYGIYNAGTMNLNGGTIFDKIYSSSNLNISVACNIKNSITLGNSASITVQNYAGTTPNYTIVLSSTRTAGTIITFVGSSTKPDLTKLSISGYSSSSYELSLQTNTSGSWTISLAESSRTVTFDPQFGTVSETSRTVKKGGAIGKLPTPTRSGYIFTGWYPVVQNSGTTSTRTTRSYVVNDNCVLYAWWRNIITRVDEDGNESSTGDFVLFGSYPQTIKASDVTIDETDVDSKGYFLGSDEERYGKKNGNAYGQNYTFTDGTALDFSTYYYFKVEPIKWRIGKESNGQAIIASENILTSYIPCYQIIDGERTVDGETVYANNYEYSHIRAFLNSYDGREYNVSDYSYHTANYKYYQSNGFYYQAFSTEEKNYILTTTVDNRSITTDNSTNEYACNNTEDKIFALGYIEAVSYNQLPTTSGAKLVTDYARANGAYYSTSSSRLGKGRWWLRSPSSGGSDVMWGVNETGKRHEEYDVDDYSIGIAPALTLNMGTSSFISNEVSGETKENENTISENKETENIQLYQIKAMQNVKKGEKQDLFFEDKKFNAVLKKVQANDDKE